MENPFDDFGTELDAKFSVQPFQGGFDLIVESQGGSTGGRAARNADYSRALRLHIQRLQAIKLVLFDVQIASRPAMRLPESARQIALLDYQLPLSLAGVDAEHLRLAIGRASAAHGRESKSGGNPTKRLKLRMLFPSSLNLSPSEITSLLVIPEIQLLPTADSDELNKNVTIARRQQRALKRSGHATPPKGQPNVPTVNAISERFVRDPYVVAWVLEEAVGYCEYCGYPAPFQRSNGEAYLEVHHVRPLAEGGPDTIDNAVACCPNCHRQLHSDPDRKLLRRRLVASVKRLQNYPRKASTDT